MIGVRVQTLLHSQIPGLCKRELVGRIADLRTAGGCCDQAGRRMIIVAGRSRKRREVAGMNERGIVIVVVVKEVGIYV